MTERKRKAHETGGDSLTSTWEEMMAEATKNPGIREVMEVYREWKKIEDDLKDYQAVINQSYPVYSSDSTTPLEEFS